MALAKNRDQYCTEWKNHVLEVVRGPVRDADGWAGIQERMNDTIHDLLNQIDQVGDYLVEDGTFSE